MWPVVWPQQPAQQQAHRARTESGASAGKAAGKPGMAAPTTLNLSRATSNASTVLTEDRCALCGYVHMARASSSSTPQSQRITRVAPAHTSPCQAPLPLCAAAPLLLLISCSALPCHAPCRWDNSLDNGCTCVLRHVLLIEALTRR